MPSSSLILCRPSLVPSIPPTGGLFHNTSWGGCGSTGVWRPLPALGSNPVLCIGWWILNSWPPGKVLLSASEDVFATTWLKGHSWLDPGSTLWVQPLWDCMGLISNRSELGHHHLLEICTICPHAMGPRALILQRTQARHWLPDCDLWLAGRRSCLKYRPECIMQREKQNETEASWGARAWPGSVFSVLPLRSAWTLVELGWGAVIH